MLQIITSGAALSGGCDSVGNRCAVSPRSLFHTKQHGSATAEPGSLWQLHAPRVAPGIVPPLLSCQPLQPALLPQSSSQNTLPNGLETSALWAGRQQERG